MPPVAPNNGGRLSDGQLANMAGIGFAGNLPQAAISNANQASPLPAINPTTDTTNNGSTPTTPTPAATPSGSVSNRYPSPAPSPLPSPLPAPVQPSTTTIESAPTISNTPSTTVTPQQAAPATVPQTVAKPQAVVKSQSKPKANTPLKNVNFKPQTPNPVLKPSVIKPNTVQNSRLGGPLGTVSNVFGRIGDTMQNAAKGRLGKGDQLRQTSLLPWQNKRR